VKTSLLGRVDYEPTYRAMQAFTDARTPDAPDELWLCEHPPVFTQGLAGKPEHVLAPGDIPVIATNRGGQVTYHGPGQVVAYPLLDLKRRGYFVKEYIYRLEESVIRTLAHYGVTGHRVAGAPGIYVRMADPGSHDRLPAGAGFDGLGKIAALGVKVSRHYTYHGLAFNVAMDLQPFRRINPCGYESLLTVDLPTIGITTSWTEAAQVLEHHLQALL
jgi:lipoyl(octanoyl) transferase